MFDKQLSRRILRRRSISYSDSDNERIRKKSTFSKSRSRSRNRSSSISSCYSCNSFIIGTTNGDEVDDAFERSEKKKKKRKTSITTTSTKTTTTKRRERTSMLRSLAVKLKELLSCGSKAVVKRRRKKRKFKSRTKQTTICWLLIVSIVATSSSKLASASAFNSQETQQTDQNQAFQQQHHNHHNHHHHNHHHHHQHHHQQQQQQQQQHQQQQQQVKNFKHHQASSYARDNERLRLLDEPHDQRGSSRHHRPTTASSHASRGYRSSATSSSEHEKELPNARFTRASHHLPTQELSHFSQNARTTFRRESRENSNSNNNNYAQTGGWASTQAAAADRPLVATRKGLVRGITQKVVTGKFVDAFLGIPFAQPPVGQYRFRHPQPAQEWSGELDASRMPNSCYQVNDTLFGAHFLGTSIWNANTPLSEDCLYLNIWTPFGVANTTLVSTPDRRPSSTSSTSSASSSSSSNNNYNNNKRPVLVWIFGGGFYSGTSSLAIYEGGLLASEEDVIVVSMNYRVSALGFLYFGRPDSPGNAGMFDQLMALQWVSDNIHQFGGDPTRVTIFGESAGAVSVALHLLSPLSRNLFHQAILQSGAATCPWGFKEAREIIDNGLQLASALNCPGVSTNETNTNFDLVLECLLKAKPMDLVSKQVGHTRAILNFPFVPVLDGSFLIESPVESLAKGNFKQAPILLGSNYDEGNSFLIYLPQYNSCPKEEDDTSSNNKESPSSVSDQQQHYAATSALSEHYTMFKRSTSSSSEEETILSGNSPEALIREQVEVSPQAGSVPITPSSNNSSTSQQVDNSDQACTPNESLSLTREDFLSVLRDGLNPFANHTIGNEAIVFEYSNWNNPQDSVSNYDALDKIVGDYYFTCHVNEFAHQYANKGNKVYMYYFKQRSSMSPWPKWMGVLHADEINFVFGEPLNQQLNYTAKEVELSRRMMKYWANFAKFGNPTKASDIDDTNTSTAEVRWPEYADKRQYFELQSDFIRIGRGPRAKQCAFWANYLPKLIESFDRTAQCPVVGTSSSTSPRVDVNLSGDNWNRPHRPSKPTTTNSYHHNQQQHHFLSNFPSALLIGLIVIFVLIIISLLVYAKRKWKIDLGISGIIGRGGGSGHRSNGRSSDRTTHEGFSVG